MVMFYFFHTLVDAESVVFVHDIIARRKLRKTGYRVSAAIAFFLLFLLFYRAKNIALADVYNSDVRVLEAAADEAHGDKHLSRLYLRIIIF